MITIWACSTDNQQVPDNPQETDNQRDLDENRAIWRSLSLQSYQFNFRRSCFCGPDYTREVIISYTNGQFHSVVYAEDLTTPNNTSYPSIEELFSIIQEAIDNEETILVVNYHPEFGYPTLISLDLPQVIDAEIAYVVDHLRINNTLHTQALLTSTLNTIADSAEFEISNAVIKLADSNESDFDALNLTIDTISSCGAAFFRFYISTALMESLPPQAQTKVVRLPLADDACDFPRTYAVVVDLTPYRKELTKSGLSEVVLHVASFSLLYNIDP